MSLSGFRSKHSLTSGLKYQLFILLWWLFAESDVFPATNVVKSIDEFSPEEGLDANFLDDVKDNKTAQVQQDDESR